MHYHLEVVIPPEAEITAALEQIMQPFSEHRERAEEDDDDGGWWDYYTIAGRWTGEKLLCRLDANRLEEFEKALHERGVTVSGFRFGKPALEPAHQARIVDALWREWFPGSGERCPLFKEGRPELGGMPDDICAVSDMPERLICHRLIVAGQDRDDPTRLRARKMLVKKLWNGLQFQDTDFAGRARDALFAMIAEDKEHSPRDQSPLRADWQCVTVDYHS